MTRSFPPDVIVLDSESLLHARLNRGKRNPRIAQAKSFRLPADTFATSLVTPELANEAALADTIRRMRNETGRWEKGSILLPDSWFRINLQRRRHRADPHRTARPQSLERHQRSRECAGQRSSLSLSSRIGIHDRGLSRRRTDLHPLAQSHRAASAAAGDSPLRELPAR